MFPNLAELDRVSKKIKNIPNKRGEYKRKVHYGCYLLCYNSGLRISEAVNFNPAERTEKGLYRIKSKGQKERFVYIPKKVIKELKKNNWKPNQTNRFTFYHFLRRIKKCLAIPNNIELTPHTLRRAFTTYHAENGLPLPLLQKLLGHSSIRTTALYWRNIYQKPNDDTADILVGKKWLEKPPKRPKSKPENPVRTKLDELPEALVINMSPNLPQPNYLSKINQLEHQLTQIQREAKLLETQNNNLKSENNDLKHDLSKLSQQKAQETSQQKQIQQDLAEAQQAIKQLEQKLTNEREKRTIAENNLLIEKKNNQSLQETNASLASKNYACEQIITNLQNTVKDKQLAEKNLNNIIQEIKKTTQQFYQWQKINYCQKLEKERSELKAQIVQHPPFKPPNK